jgi:hypothetical protein
MRGADVTQEGLFVMKQTVDYIPAGHPLIPLSTTAETAHQ